MRKAFQLLAIIVFTIGLSNCKKNEVTATPDPVVPYTPGTTITTGVAGKIINQSGNPLSGVEITIGSTTVLTDIAGNFIIPKATIGDKVGFIKARKASYFDGSRTIQPKAKTINNIIIQMVEKKTSGTFSNASGGTVTVATGGKIEFPAGAVVTKTGAAYSGTVTVSAYYLNPTDKNCYREMPGDLRGISTSNNEEILSSFGMMNVELNGSSGEALQIATGKTATLTFPVDASLTGNAPATIPLWFFDESKGLWVQQGTATKTGNNYVGTVSHFTWWNCDWGGGPLEITATFVDQNRNPLNNYHVYFITQGGWGAGGGHGMTASDGTITGKIPANKQIVLKVSKYNPCNNYAEYILLDSLIGPFTANVNLGVVIVTIPNLTSNSILLKGTVNGCSGNAMADGYAIIKINNDTYYEKVTNGVFNRTITFCSPVATSTATVSFFDNATLNTNITPVNVNITGSGTYNVGTVSACGIQVAIHYTATVQDQFGNTPQNFMYLVFVPDSVGQRFIQNGVVSAIIKANTILTRKIYAYNNCNLYELVDSTQIGPFTTDFNAGVITVNIPQQNTFTISGTATNCSNSAVAKGTALIDFDGYSYQTPVTNGSFSLTVKRCSSVQTTAAINVVDSNTNQQNTAALTVTISNANINVGNIQACGLSSIQFYNYSIDGVNYTCSFGNDSINKTGASVGNTFTIIDGIGYSPYRYIYAYTPGKTLGTFGVSNAYMTTNTLYYYSDSATSNTTITFTEFGSPGQFVAGTISGNFKKSGSAIFYPLSGSFRLRRTY